MPADDLSPATNAPPVLAVQLRTPSLADAAAMAGLVEQSGVLDANSRYCYLLLCRDFAETCLVAERGGAVLGFVTAYRPPARADTLFVWQIGIAPDARRQGLARRLLRALLERPACRDVRFLEATVTPSNTASRCLFQTLAADLEVGSQIDQAFSAALLGGEHEAEELFRIGPLSGAQHESELR